MKNKLLHLCILLVAGLFQRTLAQTKYALLFGIGIYPEEGGWPKIAGLRDLAHMDTALRKQGFLDANIKVWKDENVTPSGIRDAFTKLITAVKPGDVVLIHVSTHGGQVEDDNGDESDGLDETIVTYHAVVPSRSKNFTRNQKEYFRDDEFGLYINRLRNKLGKSGDVLILMDMCHSGSGTRGYATVRGGQPPLVSPGFKRDRYVAKSIDSVFDEPPLQDVDEQSLATYVVISAARAEDLSYETTDDNNEKIGPLTYAISKVFQNLDVGETYRSLFSKVHSLMNTKMQLSQHPVIEGNGLDRELMGGRFVQQKPFIEIEKLSGKQLTVKAGLLAGLDTGAKIAIYPSGTTDPLTATVLAVGTVSQAGSYTATVNLDKDPGINQPSLGWVFVTEPIYRIGTIGIIMDSAFGEAAIIKMKEALKSLPFISFNGKPELTIRKGTIADSIKLASTGYLFKTIDTPLAVEILKEQIKQYAQYRFLKELEIKDARMQVEVKLLPKINGKADTSFTNTKTVKTEYSFSEGDTVLLWIKNKGKVSVYLNILDLQPDGVITPILPNRSKKLYPRDLKVEAGASWLSKSSYIISPPYGTEIFKIFASQKEIDIESVVTTQGKGTGGNVSEFEKFLKSLYNVETLKRGVVNGKNDGSISSLLFEIKPRQAN